MSSSPLDPDLFERVTGLTVEDFRTPTRSVCSTPRTPTTRSTSSNGFESASLDYA